MFNRGIRTGVRTGAAFNAFLDVFRHCFSIHQLKDLYRTCSDAFTSAFAFIIVNGYRDISFLKFFLHVNITSIQPHSVTTTIILDFLFTIKEIIKKYQCFFI